MRENLQQTDTRQAPRWERLAGRELLPGEEWTTLESVLVSKYRPLALRLAHATSLPDDPELLTQVHAELRCLVANRILNVDQKVLYRDEFSPQETNRKREQYDYLSRLIVAAGEAPLAPVNAKLGGLEQLRQMKLAALGRIQSMELGLSGAEWKSLEATSGHAERFGYVSELRERFGDNLAAVCVYGSAVYAPSFSDYDNFVVVKDLEEGYREARGLRLIYEGRPVHLNLLPEKQAREVLACAMLPTITSATVALAHGKLEFATWPNETLLAHNWVRALEMVRRRRLALKDGPEAVAKEIARLPEHDGKPLYESLAFLPSVFIEWAIRFQKWPEAAPRAKRQIIADLKGNHYPLIDYERDQKTLTRGLYGALESMKALLEKGVFANAQFIGEF